MSDIDITGLHSKAELLYAHAWKMTVSAPDSIKKHLADVLEMQKRFKDKPAQYRIYNRTIMDVFMPSGLLDKNYPYGSIGYLMVGCVQNKEMNDMSGSKYPYECTQACRIGVHSPSDKVCMNRIYSETKNGFVMAQDGKQPAVVQIASKDFISPEELKKFKDDGNSSMVVYRYDQPLDYRSIVAPKPAGSASVPAGTAIGKSPPAASKSVDTPDTGKSMPTSALGWGVGLLGLGALLYAFYDPKKVAVVEES